jgi:hypothetical protein
MTTQYVQESPSDRNAKRDYAAPAEPAFPFDGIHRALAQMLVDSSEFDALTDWEQSFAQDIAKNPYPTLNEKQWGVLARCMATVSRAERRAAGGAK